MARVAQATLICRAEMLHSSTHPDETHVITRLATAESILTASGGQFRHPSAGLMREPRSRLDGESKFEGIATPIPA